MLSTDEIRAAIEKAFQPLRCVAEIWDYDQKLRVKVSDAKDRGIVEIPNLILREVREKSNLKSVLSSARSVVEEKGFRLEPLIL